MHGRLKVRSSEEQKAEKHKQQQKKLASYRIGMKQILSTRQQDTYDPTSFAISSQLLAINPEIYTLWNYRKEVALIEIRKSNDGDVESEPKLIKFLEGEIKLTEQCLLANPKSYGAWHHRYWVLINHPKPNWRNEFNLCNKYLNYDDRNFHVWDFRRLIINKIGITLTDELKFSTERLNANFSNYSSWHYRSTLMHLNPESLDTELSLVQNAVFTDPADSSAWFYLRWVLSSSSITTKMITELLDGLEQLQEMEPDCKWIFMARCWLTGSLLLSDPKHIDKRVQFYKKLIEIDPQRKGQYQDYLALAQPVKNNKRCTSGVCVS